MEVIPDLIGERGRSMENLRQDLVRNHLLAAMKPGDFARLQPDLVRVRTHLDQTLIVPNEPVLRAYFPETGYASVVAGTDRSRIEVGVIGPEGLIGATPVLLGSDRTPHRTFVQVPGEMLAVDTARLGAAVEASFSLRTCLLRFVQTHLIQIGQTAYGHAMLPLQIRLARWILMSHDRVGGDEMPVTHAFLAQTLGSQRSGATLSVQALEARRLITARRGRITVRDRKALEALAASSYGLPEDEYHRLIPQGPDPERGAGI